jgi:flagellar FliL protein
MSTSADALPLPDEPANAKAGLGAILIPVLLSTVLTLVVVGGGVAWLLKSGKLGAGAANSATASPTAVVVPPPTHVLVLEPIVVNLADAGGHSYLRAAVSLRIQDEEKTDKKSEEKKDPKAVDGAAIALRDTTLTVLSSETSDSLLQHDSRETLKKKLDDEYKLHNTESRVMEIYFAEFLVQRG